MKSTEFLTEAESNLAVKKLDKYLDMLSNDNLRGLIPLVRKSLSMNEADDKPTQYFGKLAPDARPASKPVSSPTLTAPTLNKGSEEAKITQVISNLSTEEKKELLSLLQKEAKTRPAAEPDKNKSSQQQTKKDTKGPSAFKGCLLPILGILGIILTPAAIEFSGTDIKGYADTPPNLSNDPVDKFLRRMSVDTEAEATRRFCKIKQGWSGDAVLKYMGSGDINYNDYYLTKKMLDPNTEVWQYGKRGLHGDYIGSLYMDKNPKYGSNGVVSWILYGDISPEDCY